MKTKVYLLISLLIMANSCTHGNNPVTPTSTGVSDNKPDVLMELVKNRRSIRSYTDEKIDPAILDKITTVGLLAPSSHGQNPVEFVVVEDKDTLRQLARSKRIGAVAVERAAAAIVVIVDKGGELWIEDASVASTYLLLAAEHYGIGACWNHIRDRQGIRLSSDEEIRQILGIPSRYTVLSIVALGHKKESKTPRSEADLDFGKVHKGNFNNK